MREIIDLQTNDFGYYDSRNGWRKPLWNLVNDFVYSYTLEKFSEIASDNMCCSRMIYANSIPLVRNTYENAVVLGRSAKPWYLAHSRRFLAKAYTENNYTIHTYYFSFATRNKARTQSRWNLEKIPRTRTSYNLLTSCVLTTNITRTYISKLILVLLCFFYILNTIFITSGLRIESEARPSAKIRTMDFWHFIFITNNLVLLQR